MSFHRAHITDVNGVSDLYSEITDFIKNTLGWTEKKTGTSQTGKPYTIFFSEGESEQETIYIGLTYYYHSEDSCGIRRRCDMPKFRQTEQIVGVTQIRIREETTKGDIREG